MFFLFWFVFRFIILNELHKGHEKNTYYYKVIMIYFSTEIFWFFGLIPAFYEHFNLNDISISLWINWITFYNPSINNNWKTTITSTTTIVTETYSSIFDSLIKWWCFVNQFPNDICKMHSTSWVLNMMRNTNSN